MFTSAVNADNTTYSIDSTVAPNHYATLEALRGDVPTLQDGDIVILGGDDSSLAQQFFGASGAGFTFQGSGTITPTGTHRFASTDGPINPNALKIDGTLDGTLTFDGFAHTSGDGGAFFIANLEGISNATFLNNDGGRGGAVMATGNSTGGIINSTFSNNKARSLSIYQPGDGGAVYVGNNFSGGISNSDFSDNSTTSNGGAVHVDYNFTDGISNSGFSNNSATSAGGAVYVGNDFSGGIINNSNFSGNTSGYNGGAVFVNGDFTDGIGYSTFSDNIADVSGGAVYVGYGFTDGILNSLFSGNKAANGGAVYVGDDFSGDISNSVFSGNEADGNAGVWGGGAMCVVSSLGTSSAYSDMSGTSFLNNKTTGPTANKGGALYIGQDAYISALTDNLTFQGNKAYGAPNAIYMDGNGDTLALGAGDEQTIYFYDPIANNSADTLTVKINDLSDNTNFTGTVLFDGSQENGKQSNIHGNTTVGGGTMKLQNGAIYGADTGNAAFTLADGVTLAVAGTGNGIKATTITFGTNSKITGSGSLTLTGTQALNGNLNVSVVASGDTLTLNTAFTDGTPAGALTKTGAGTLTLSGAQIYTGNTNINDGTLQFGDTGSITSTGNFLVNTGGTLNVSTLKASSITAGSFQVLGNLAGTLDLSVSGNYINTTTTIDDDTQDLLTALVPTEMVGLKMYEADFSTGFAVTSTTITADDFATQNKMNRNAVGAGSQINAVDDLRDYANSLLTDEQVAAYIESIESAPEAAAEFQGVTLWNPYKRIANQRLFKTGFNNNAAARGILGQAPCEPVCGYNSGKREFWFEGYYRYEDVNNDGNANGYKTNRGGMLLGVDKQIDRKLLLGATFGYGNPRANNRLARIEADDYTVGLYAKYNLSSSVFVNAFLGYGHQNYEFRNVLNRTDYNGDSMYATVELAKQVNYSRQLKLFPLIAVDFQKSWSDDFTVNVLPVGTTQRIANDSLDQTVLRFGVNSQYGNLRTRLQYGYQVGGELYGTSRSIIGGTTQTFRGVNLGRNTFNAGIGGDIPLTSNTLLFADYDFDLGERATAHTGQAGFVAKW
jgi:autotransporter-associated beta strand protein/predicted outer membrane repeat protein